MNITIWDKLKIRLKIYGQLYRMPRFKDAIRMLINPIDSTRDIEFCYLVKFLDQNYIKPENVMDISSPFLMSYVLSEHSNVIKTDINPIEMEMIKESQNLKFKLEDGTKLSFADNSFDLVYSISVIEHIYKKYTHAVNEMIRVLKPGGYLYLTFPVAPQHLEEWLDYKVYSEQYEKAGKTFFQYRFDSVDIENLLTAVKDVELIEKSIYWERTKGGYDRVMKILQRKPIIEKLTSVRNGLINLWSSFSLMENQSSDFVQSKSFGNAIMVFRKTSDDKLCVLEKN